MLSRGRLSPPMSLFGFLISWFSLIQFQLCFRCITVSPALLLPWSSFLIWWSGFLSFAFVAICQSHAPSTCLLLLLLFWFSGSINIGPNTLQCLLVVWVNSFGEMRSPSRVMVFLGITFIWLLGWRHMGICAVGRVNYDWCKSWSIFRLYMYVILIFWLPTSLFGWTSSLLVFPAILLGSSIEVIWSL